MSSNKMTPQEIVDTTAKQTWDKQLKWEALSVDDAYTYFNYVYLWFRGDVEDLDKSIEQQARYLDSDSWQYEYALIQPNSATQQFGIWKPDKVYVKPSSIDDYKQYQPIDQTNLKNDFEWLSLYQPQSDPVYLKRDRTIMLFPKPQETLSNWILIYWSPVPFKIDSSMGAMDSTILIPGRFHDSIVVWLKPRFYGARWWEYVDKKNEAKFEYRDEKKIALAKMITDNTEPVYWALDDDIYNLE